MLNQQKLNGVSSETSDLSIVLFDEIEKAAGSMTRILLGILDKATLRLGDNTSVNFEKTLIFLTSNLGAQTMAKEIRPDFGFESFVPREKTDSRAKLQKIGISAVRRKFSPEFVNRIDSVITYQPLSSESLSQILDQHISELQEHIHRRLAQEAFTLDVPTRTRRYLLKAGTSDEYGARELKRTLQRVLIQPLAVMLANGMIKPGCRIRADLNESRTKVVLRTPDDNLLEPAC